MTNLSSAAQAVLDAAEQVPIVLNYAQEIPAFCAAALRAAADQVEWPADVSLRIIASELEGQ